jgi:hypothetical protein
VVTAWGAPDMAPTIVKYAPPPPTPLPSAPPSPLKAAAQSDPRQMFESDDDDDDDDDDEPLPDFDGEDWETMLSKKPKKQKQSRAARAEPVTEEEVSRPLLCVPMRRCESEDGEGPLNEAQRHTSAAYV